MSVNIIEELKSYLSDDPANLFYSFELHMKNLEVITISKGYQTCNVKDNILYITSLENREEYKFKIIDLNELLYFTFKSKEEEFRPHNNLALIKEMFCE